MVSDRRAVNKRNVYLSEITLFNGEPELLLDDVIHKMDEMYDMALVERGEKSLTTRV